MRDALLEPSHKVHLLRELMQIEVQEVPQASQVGAIPLDNIRYVHPPNYIFDRDLNWSFPCDEEGKG